MAVANSLAGVKIGGARQIECTINGLGERAGNCSLEEVVMAVRTRKDYFDMELGVDASQILAASRMVSQTTGFVVQPNKAIVGANAFAHASGIHQDGMMKARDTYEIMRAEDVGWAANKIVMGKLSGRNAFKQRLQELGVQIDSEVDINTAFAKFKELADRKSEIFDEDILALVSEENVMQSHDHFGFVSLAQHSETGELPEATVVMTIGGKEVCGTSNGNGPVDASLKAIEVHVKSGAEMVLYSVNAISGSTESQGEVTVRLQSTGRVVNGVGADPDIVVASAKAYLSALNKLQNKAEKVSAQG
jgi:2-isopropylmalate synthase